MSGALTETDLIVIGSGATGLAAAVTAADGGAKASVFEKQRSLGGTSNFFEGTFAVESDVQRKKYVSYSRDEAFRNLMEYSHWRANPRLVRTFVDESAATIVWLQRLGVEFVDAINNVPDAPATYHVVKGKGEAVIKILADRARENGVHILPGTPVKRILKEGEAIAGVVIGEEGEEKKIRARAVVIGTGGYANNRDWMKRYSGVDPETNIVIVGNVDKTGDGIRMAWEVGAADEGLGPLELYRIGPIGPEFAMESHLQTAAVQPDLWVDQKGERFCDEGISFHDTSIGNANARFKEGYTYSIFDDSMKEEMLGRGIDRNFGQNLLPGTRLVDIDKELKSALDGSTSEVFAAGSVKELAEKMGVAPGVLQATVGEYNGYCEKGHDDLFAKNPLYLRPLRGPKYYAVKARTVCLGTLGGIKINHRMEVVDRKGQVIPGLYAGGYDAGGMWGDSYPIDYASGASSGFAINSGRIAGRHILNYLMR
jgi:fumarate reductase flavoprotein subunit